MTFQPVKGVTRAAKPHRRPLAYRLHSLLGLKLSLLLAFVCATGTLATVSHEIEWLLFPQVRATATAQPASWGAMWDAARAERPDGWLRGIGPYDRSDATYFARDAMMRLPDGQEISLLVDSGTGRVTGEQVGTQFHAFMRGLHYYLFTPGDWGFYLVTSLGFILLGSLVTGLIVYKRFWRGLFKQPRAARGARTLLGDLHRLAALWALPFTAAIALTSIWYFAERAGVEWESQPPANANLLRKQPTGEQVDRWVATAAAAMPGLVITGIALPEADGAPVMVQGEWKAWLVRERTNAAYIDPVSGQLLGLRVAHAMGAGERIVHTADPLHFGNFAGLGGKLLWFVFGVMLTGLAVSGAMIHGKRLVGGGEHGVATAWRRSLGAAAWPTLLLITAVPTWFFFNGWQSAGMTVTVPAGQLNSSAGLVSLSRDQADAQLWCARPVSAVQRLALVTDRGTTVPAHFDAGEFCGALAPGERPIRVDLR